MNIDGDDSDEAEATVTVIVNSLADPEVEDDSLGRKLAENGDDK